MSRRSGSVTQYNNDQMCFALVENDCSLDLEEVEPRTERNLRNCLKLALKKTFKTETNHTLYVLINGRCWLEDPLTHIQEAVEAVGGRIKDYNLENGHFTLYTKDEHQLEIFIHGRDKDELEENNAPDEEDNAQDANEDEEEKYQDEEVVVKQEVVEIINKPEVVEMLNEPEVVEILDNHEFSDSESDYEDFSNCGMTQLVNQVSGASFQFPQV